MAGKLELIIPEQFKELFAPSKQWRHLIYKGGRRAWPDMLIAEAQSLEDKCYHTFFIELKKDGTRIFKKDGTLVSDAHICEQFDMLEQLRRRGYVAEFACGFDEAKKILDRYLG